MKNGTPRGKAVLVVEDDALLRLDIVLALSDAGFAVVEAPDAEEALAILEARNGIGVVFSDVEMPGMNGLELRRTIRARWPEVEVLLTSGVKDLVFEDGRGPSEFFPKPYDNGAVITSVREHAA